jgi:hypothetical protein
MAALLPLEQQQIPFLGNPQVFAPKELKEGLRSVRAALNHVEKTGFLNFATPLHHTLLQASRGNLSTPQGGVNKALATRLLYEGFPKEDPQLFAYYHYFEHLWKHVTITNPETAMAETLSEATNAELLKQRLWLNFKEAISQYNPVDNPNYQTQIAGALADLVGTLRHGAIVLEKPTLFQKYKPVTVTFELDKFNQLGLRNNHLDSQQPLAYLQRVANQLIRLQRCTATFMQLVEQQSSTELERSTQAHLLPSVQRSLLRLAYAHQGDHPMNRAALNRLINLPKQSPLRDLLTFGLQQECLRTAILPNITNATLMPQLLTNMALAITLMGVAWNWADNNVIQKIQSDVVDKKGDVLGAGCVLLASAVPGALATWGLMRSNTLKTLTNNHPMGKLLIASGVGLALETACSVAGLKYLFAHKKALTPTMKPTVQGQVHLQRATTTFSKNSATEPLASEDTHPLGLSAPASVHTLRPRVIPGTPLGSLW